MVVTEARLARHYHFLSTCRKKTERDEVFVLEGLTDTGPEAKFKTEIICSKPEHSKTLLKWF
jgi:hypothetical protein